MPSRWRCVSWRSLWLQHIDVAAVAAVVGSYEDPPPCQHWLVTHCHEIAPVGHRDIGQHLWDLNHPKAGPSAILLGEIINICAPPCVARYDARIGEDKEMALIGADKNDPAGHGRRAKGIGAPGDDTEGGDGGGAWDFRNPANAGLLGSGAGIERM